MMLELDLPYPPSVNHCWRRVGNKTLISREGRRFRERVIALLSHLHVEPLEAELYVEVDVHPPDRRRRDLDNVLKALLDAMQHGGAYHDDGQIVHLVVKKCEPLPGGRARVRIRNN